MRSKEESEELDMIARSVSLNGSPLIDLIRAQLLVGAAPVTFRTKHHCSLIRRQPNYDELQSGAGF